MLLLEIFVDSFNNLNLIKDKIFDHLRHEKDGIPTNERVKRAIFHPRFKKQKITRMLMRIRTMANKVLARQVSIETCR